MNDKRRTALHEALQLLNRVVVVVEGACNSEQDAIDNYPENLQSTERYENMECAADNLNDAIEKIDEAKEYIEAAVK